MCQYIKFIHSLIKFGLAKHCTLYMYANNSENKTVVNNTRLTVYHNVLI